MEEIFFEGLALEKLQILCAKKSPLLRAIHVEDAGNTRYYCATNGRVLAVFKEVNPAGGKLKEPLNLVLGGKIKKDMTEFKVKPVDDNVIVLSSAEGNICADLEERFVSIWQNYLQTDKAKPAEKYCFISPRDLALAAKFADIEETPLDLGNALCWKFGLWTVVVCKSGRTE